MTKSESLKKIKKAEKLAEKLEGRDLNELKAAMGKLFNAYLFGNDSDRDAAYVELEDTCAYHGLRL